MCARETNVRSTRCYRRFSFRNNHNQVLATINGYSLQLDREHAGAIMTEALDLQEALAAERGISIERGRRSRALRSHACLQVFGNILANSIKFCRAGGSIVVTSRRVGDELELSGNDDGPGISPDVLPTLFDPYRVPPSQAHAGSGLGLHICKGIIERHGRIWAGSEGDQGTTMYFTLPVTE